MNIVLPDGSAVSRAFTVSAGAIFAFTAASPLVLTDFPFRAGMLVEDALIQAGQSTTITLTLTNAGVPIAGATVLWSVQPARSLVFPSPSSITDANGNASIVVTVLQEGDILVRGIVGSSLGLPGFQTVRGTGAITAIAEIEQVVDVPLILGFNGYVGPNATAAALFDVSTFDIAWKLQDGEWIYYVPRQTVPGSVNFTLRSGDIFFLSVLR